MVKNVLLLGGNGFIGFECLLKLLESNGQGEINVFTANRGKSSDWGKASISDKITWVKYDRRNDVDEHPGFQQLLETTSFHAVVDFSAYRRSELKRLLPHLKAKAALYIYISSDSVYEVCVKEDPSAPSKETDAKRPRSVSERQKLKKKDEYGHDKLKCEEYIEEFCCKNAMEYVILRLADVIGPRDGTDRWWQYQLWVHLCSQLSLPLYVPADLEKRSLSLVYVTDIATLVHNIITMSDASLKRVVNQSFNLACTETTTVAELLETIHVYNQCKKGCSLDVRFSEDASVPHIYPSVERGPVDITKAGAVLNWSPTPLNDVIKRTIKFYDDVLSGDRFSEEKQDIFDTLIEEDLSHLTLYTENNLVELRNHLSKLLKLK